MKMEIGRNQNRNTDRGRKWKRNQPEGNEGTREEINQ